MKISHFRLTEAAAATLVSTVVLLVAITPALLAAPLGAQPRFNAEGRASAAIVVTESPSIRRS
jgi:hypothetical protein